MKKAISLIAALSMLLGCTACGGSSSSDKPADTTASKAADTTKAPDDGKKQTINLYAFTDEVPNMVKRYIETHEDFGKQYELKVTQIPTTNQEYQPALDAALKNGGVDMFAAEAAFVKKYTQGDMSQYVSSYEDLGIQDVNDKIKSAEIAQYTVDIGTKDGKVVGLGYQATGGAFIYRRSIAKAVWGTDDPAQIKDKVGPGWDKFWAAAAELKAKGYGIVSGDGDVWHAVENGSDKGWLTDDGKLYIDPKREQFLDISKQLTDKGWSNKTQDWTHAWYADMRDYGGQNEEEKDGQKIVTKDSDIKTADTKQIFGYFGPAWLINYVIVNQVNGTAKGQGTFGDWAICESPVGFFWGGTWVLGTKDSKVKDGVAKIIEWITLDTTEDGLQYKWANGTLYDKPGAKDAVASAVVMKKSDGKNDLLDGQNMFEVFVPANSSAKGSTLTQYDEAINAEWRDQVRAYAKGDKSKEAAIKDFKTVVNDKFGIAAAE
ncbi:MAG: ABC transporter substrate-binding protein [Oscillospiraceae bacterium]|nr:ABC transporter substrate-binding protein [Oscillospiraceae bacterium]